MTILFRLCDDLKAQSLNPRYKHGLILLIADALLKRFTEYPCQLFSIKNTALQAKFITPLQELSENDISPLLLEIETLIFKGNSKSSEINSILKFEKFLRVIFQS